MSTTVDGAAARQDGRDHTPEEMGVGSSDGSVDLASDVEAVAEALAEQADERTEELQDARRVPEDLYRAAAPQLFRQLVVAELGGLERTPLEWFRTGVRMARHEASYAWVVTQGAAELGWVATGGDDDWAREFLDDPLATSASTSAGVGSLRIEGDRSRLSGRWGFDTGCQWATWIGGMAIVEDRVDERGMPVLCWGWVPADRAEILDDWDATGLRGTGSHSIVIPDQEIPTAWTFSPFDTTDNDRGPYRCMVGNGNWPIAASIAAVQLGNARRALDEARSIVLTKKPSPDFRPLSQHEAVLRWIAEGEGLWLAASASMERELDSMWQEATAAEQLSSAQRVRLHIAAITANDLSVRIVDGACRATGTASVARHHVLGRCRRDAHALESHISTNGVAAEYNSRMSLGLLDEHILV